MTSDIPLKIFTVLIESDRPLGRKDICLISNIQPQLFDYWMPQMLNTGIVINADRKKYTVQSILKDEVLLELTRPLIEKISTEIKYPEESKEYLDSIVYANLSIYMRYLSEEPD